LIRKYTEEEMSDWLKEENLKEIKNWIAETKDINESFEYYDEDEEREYRSYPFLINAVSAGKLGIVRLLLENGANVNVKGYDGQTPLYTAVQRQNKKMVEFLLHFHADVNLTGKYDKTPLFCAVNDHSNDNYSLKNILTKEQKENKLEIIRLLLEKGANPNQQEKSVRLSALKCAKQYALKEELELMESFIN